ncbi:11099_t:CDS:2, partial [Racocetra fulgida]
RSFPIDIDKSTISIGHLKELIKKKKDPYYNNISAVKFELWSVDIPINLENIDTKIYEEKISEYKGVRLLPNAVVETVLSENNKNSIRILVQPPATTGGLGGTNMKRKEDGLGYEGLDLTHIDNICQRKQTINKLIDDLLKKRIILVRSPPMAGKTSLAQLLEHNILQSDEVKNGLRCVFRISLMWMIKRGMEWTFAEGFKTLMNMEWGEFIQLCKHSDIGVVLIVDEVQLIYKPHNESEPRNGGGIFWDTFKEVKQYLTNLCIVAFASYGYYGSYTSYGDHSAMDISPPSILCKDNTWDFSDVCFTDEEFDDYFYRFCEMRLHMLKKGDIPFLHNYVREITAYHPGLITFTMDECIRATPQVIDMSDEEKKIVDKVLFKKSLKIQTNRTPYNSRIIKTNVLVDIGKTVGRSTLNFPAPLLMATYLQDRFGHITRSISPPKTLEDFIKSVFAIMNPKILQNSKGRSKDGRLFERVWQMEFYRASLQVLPDDIYPSVDVGKVFRSKGYVDFYINDNRNWAIELLRDGEKLDQHKERFQKVGIYGPILKHTKQWAIIDVRNNKMKAPALEKREQNEIYAFFSENFEFVQLVYPNGTKEDIRLLGEENLLGYDISEFLDDSMEID